MSDRIHRFVDSMKIQPRDRVLEIGCGHGAAAGLICGALTTGVYLGIDRSAKMVAAATKRNLDHVSSGRARFALAALESLELGDERFDKVFAIRVRLFHDEPVTARRLAERWLVPGGRLFFEYETPAPR